MGNGKCFFLLFFFFIPQTFMVCLQCANHYAKSRKPRRSNVVMVLLGWLVVCWILPSTSSKWEEISIGGDPALQLDKSEAKNQQIWGMVPKVSFKQHSRGIVPEAFPRRHQYRQPRFSVREQKTCAYSVACAFCKTDTLIIVFVFRWCYWEPGGIWRPTQEHPSTQARADAELHRTLMWCMGR